MIAQVDEDEIAMIALAMDPSGDADGLAGMGGAKFAASMSAIGVHHYGLYFSPRIARSLDE
jgi:hypothetical protein